jgi:hypothetical protein
MREKLIAVATPYATQGAERCSRYRYAKIVAIEKLIIACPERKLLAFPSGPLRLLKMCRSNRRSRQ